MNSAVLIVDGDSYFSAVRSMSEVESQFSHLTFLQNLENEFKVKFVAKYFYCTQVDRDDSAELYQRLEGNDFFGSGYCLKKYGLKQTSAKKTNLSSATLSNQCGMEVAIGTKIIESAYGLNGEILSDLIILVSSNENYQPAILCAEARKNGLVKVVSTKTASLLSIYGTNIPCIEDLMKLSAVSNENRQRKSAVSTSKDTMKPSTVSDYAANSNEYEQNDGAGVVLAPVVNNKISNQRLVQHDSTAAAESNSNSADYDLQQRRSFIGELKRSRKSVRDGGKSISVFLLPPNKSKCFQVASRTTSSTCRSGTVT
jgi:hypothetical protein